MLVLSRGVNQVIRVRDRSTLWCGRWWVRGCGSGSGPRGRSALTGRRSISVGSAVRIRAAILRSYKELRNL